MAKQEQIKSKSPEEMSREELIAYIYELEWKSEVKWGKLMESTRDEVKGAKLDMKNMFVSKIDQSLESYPWLNEWQKEVIRWIRIKNPDAIESITQDEIVIKSMVDGKLLQTLLPLKDTKHETLKPMQLSKTFIDKRWKKSKELISQWKQPLTKHDYIAGYDVEEYYKLEQHKKERLNQAEIESIILLMPSWDDYKYGTWWQPMKQFITLLWLADQDLTALMHLFFWADLDVLGYVGYIWLGAKDDDDCLLSVPFSSDKARLSRNNGVLVFRARLLKKLSS
jgi:hypothetical protein